MDSVLHEVAVLTSYTKRDVNKDVDLLPDPLQQCFRESCNNGISGSFIDQSVCLPDITKPPPFYQRMHEDIESINKFANTFELKRHALKCTQSSEGEASSISEYLSAQEPGVDYDTSTTTSTLFNDTESSGYVSASSSLLEDVRGRSLCSSGPSSRSSSLSDSSRSSSLTDPSRRTSYSSDESSRASSISDVDSMSRGSEDNFADIESNDSQITLEGRQKHLSSRRTKSKLTKTKFVTPLETIFSPTIDKASNVCMDSTFIDESYHTSINISRDQLHGENSVGDKSDSSSLPYETMSDATNSALNPLSQPFVPRSLRFQDDSFILRSSSDAEEYVVGNSLDLKNYENNNRYVSRAGQNESNIVGEIGTLKTARLNNDSGFISQSFLSEHNSNCDLSYLENDQGRNTCAYFAGQTINSDQVDKAPDVITERVDYQYTPCQFSTAVAKPYEICHTEDSSCKSAQNSSFYSAKTSFNTNSVFQPYLEADTTPIDKGPYDCGINHRNDFCCMKSFSLTDLPGSCKNFKIWDSVVTLSQRVVRLSVLKPLNIQDDIRESKCNPMNYEQFEHYATGFVYSINSDYLEVRTHIQVVSSSEEASKTRVTFDFGAKGRNGPDIYCYGLKEGYCCNRFSQTCVFRCKTPPSILEHLQLFKEIPMKYSNLFYDSSYFSDSSPDTSIDLEDILTNDILLSSGTHQFKDSLDMNERVSNSDLLSDIVDSLDSPAWETYEIPAKEWDIEDIQHAVESLSEELKSSPRENPFAYCGVDESIVKNAFESINIVQYDVPPIFETTEISNWPDITSHDLVNEELPTPLSIMEKRATESARDGCPYKDLNVFESIGEYDYFSSHAGDVLGNCLPVFPLVPNLSPYAESQARVSWEYEGLVHAQTHHRDAYNHFYNVMTKQNSKEDEFTWRRDSHLDDLPEMVKPEVKVSNTPTATCIGEEFSLDTKKILSDISLSSRGNLAYWNYSFGCDLKDVNRDENNTNVLCDFKDMVDKMVSEDDEKYNKKHCGACPKTEKMDMFSLIVSYPHGGEKMLSVGKFSSHRHFGGELHDTPTCMGSCGAPIISVERGGSGAYLTQYIHAGTGKVNGITCGMAVSYFD